jgi:hypothetical protein
MKKIESVWADITAKNEAYKQKFSKQEKVDLSELEKVELGVIDELKSLEKQARDIASDRIAESKEVEKLYQRVNKENFAAKEKIDGFRKEAFRIAMDAERVLKDLGMDVPNELFTRVDAVAEAGGKIPTSRNANVFSI